MVILRIPFDVNLASFFCVCMCVFVLIRILEIFHMIFNCSSFIILFSGTLCFSSTSTPVIKLLIYLFIYLPDGEYCHWTVDPDKTTWSGAKDDKRIFLFNASLLYLINTRGTKSIHPYYWVQVCNCISVFQMRTLKAHAAADSTRCIFLKVLSYLHMVPKFSFICHWILFFILNNDLESICFMWTKFQVMNIHSLFEGSKC